MKMFAIYLLIASLCNIRINSQTIQAQAQSLKFENVQLWDKNFRRSIGFDESTNMLKFDGTSILEFDLIPIKNNLYWIMSKKKQECLKYDMKGFDLCKFADDSLLFELKVQNDETYQASITSYKDDYTICPQECFGDLDDDDEDCDNTRDDFVRRKYTQVGQMLRKYVSLRVNKLTMVIILEFFQMSIILFELNILITNIQKLTQKNPSKDYVAAKDYITTHLTLLKNLCKVNDDDLEITGVQTASQYGKYLPLAYEIQFQVKNYKEKFLNLNIFQYQPENEGAFKYYIADCF